METREDHRITVNMTSRDLRDLRVRPTQLSYNEIRDKLMERVEGGDSEIEVWQQRPYTAVRVQVEEPLMGMMVAGLGFAKVNWPDKWDPEYGRKMALRKAVASIAKRLVGRDSVPRFGIATVHGGLPDSVSGIQL